MPRQALHAKTLGFIHPHTKEKVFFESELPQDISDLINKLKS
jgi:23S rRNA pseudouridine1911/1915/1917 synthase